MSKLIVSTGQVFGRLTVLKESERLRLPSGQTNRAFVCLCECGKRTTVRLVHLSRRRITSCGCIKGESHDPKYDGLYNTWRGMKSRCKAKSGPTHKNYSGKGIKVCEEWELSFHTFLDFALKSGWKHGLEIDRIDSNKGYHPSNCRFVNQLQQSNNVSTNIHIEYNGEIRPFGLVINEANKTSHMAAIRGRIKRGWTAQKAIDTPIKCGNYLKGKRT